MAHKSRPSYQKSNREKAKRQKRQEKLARRLEARDRGAETKLSATRGEDPDIAGIVPGPQPPNEWWHDGGQQPEGPEESEE
jgi:hypothetical protein